MCIHYPDIKILQQTFMFIITALKSYRRQLALFMMSTTAAGDHGHRGGG